MLIVLTPTLGRTGYLRDTIASVARIPGVQKKHYLICPSDQCDRLAKEYPTCSVIPEVAGGRGVFAAVNDGVASIKDDWRWFTYINDDDLLLEGFAEVCKRHLSQENERVIAYGDTIYIDANGKELFPMPRETDTRHFPSLMSRGINPLIQQGCLISRSLFEGLGGFSSEFRICADYEFFVRALTRCDASFRYYPYRVGAFRVIAGQISGNVAKLREETDRVRKQFFPAPSSAIPELYSLLRFRLINWRAYFARFRSRGLQRSAEILRDPPR